MHVTSYLSLPWTSPCISVKQIFLNLSTYEIPFGLKTYNGFQFFTELSTPALPWHAKPYLHNLAPTDLSRFIFYCFTVIFAPPSSFASLRVGALPSLSVLFQKLAPLSFLLYQKQQPEGTVRALLCLEYHHEIVGSLSQILPRLWEHLPGQISKPRTRLASSWGVSLLCL